MPNGLVHIVEPMCSADLPEPSVLWFCMQSAGNCTGGCNSGVTCPFAPYRTPGLPAPTGYPNPNLPSSTPYHANVARHWRAPPTFYVWCPQGVGSNNTDIFGGSLGGGYSYCEFAQDVCYAMAKFSAITNTATSPILGPMLSINYGCTTACPVPPLGTIGSPYTSMYAIYGGISAPNGFGGPGITVTNNYTAPPNLAGSNIWSTVNGGPTGDCKNEMIFLQGLVNGGGLTSMIMDPVRGTIQECDCIWGTSGGAAFSWPARTGPATCVALPGCAIGGPGWTTGIPHEVGHFFGLDHTNLHPGHSSSGSSADPCIPFPIGNVGNVGTAPTSLFTFTSTTQYPDMVGAINWVGYWRNDPTLPIHPDDEAGLAELYPVTSPGASNVTPQPLPIRNAFGSMEGSVAILFPPNVRNQFGVNVIPRRQAATDPRVGKISGTCRLTPGVGVVGAIDTATNILTSGEFRIDGIGNGPNLSTSMPPPGAPYDLALEPLGSLGFQTTPAGGITWAEWFYDFTYNPSINLLSFGGQQLVVSAAPNGQWTSGPYGIGGSPSLGSLFVAPGTVIQLQLNLSNGAVYSEPVSRPVVMLSPRSGRPVPFSSAGLVTATIIHDYELDFASPVWIVNGVVVPAGAYLTTNQPAVPIPAGTPYSGPFTTTFQMSYAGLGIGATGTAIVRFTAFEYPSNGNPNRPNPGITAVAGINEDRF
jgi:hypothetical protein